MLYTYTDKHTDTKTYHIISAHYIGVQIGLLLTYYEVEIIAYSQSRSKNKASKKLNINTRILNVTTFKGKQRYREYDAKTLFIVYICMYVFPNIF